MKVIHVAKDGTRTEHEQTSDADQAMAFLASERRTDGPQAAASLASLTDAELDELERRTAAGDEEGARALLAEAEQRVAAGEPGSPEETDDGMRFACSSCESYVKPDPEGSGMKCDACGQWFTLCDECMPDVDSYSSDAVWLCEECR